MTKDKQNQGLAIQELSKPLLSGSSNPSFFPVSFRPLTSSVKPEESCSFTQIKENDVESLNVKNIKPHVEAKTKVDTEKNVPALETVKSTGKVKPSEVKITNVQGSKSLIRIIIESIVIGIILALGLTLGYILLHVQKLKKRSTHKPNAV
jgi:hypothetical protein